MLVDMNIHYRVLKFMHGESTVGYDFRQWLCSLPLLYGVWHPYKYAVLQVYKAFFPIFVHLEFGDLTLGQEVRCFRKVLHVEKLICGLLLVQHLVVPVVEYELRALNDGASSSSSAPGVLDGRRKIWLEGLLVLLKVYCPALLAIGTAVRNCTWDGRYEKRGSDARQVLQDCLILLANVLGDTSGKVEYMRTLCVALL